MKILSEEEVKIFEANQQVKFVVGKFREAMVQFDSFEEKLNNSLNASKEFTNKLSAVEIEHEKISENIDSLKKITIANSSGLNVTSEKLSTSIASLGFDVDLIKTEINDITSVFSHLNGKIEHISEKNKGFALNEDVLSIKNNVKSLYEDMNNKLNTYQENQKDLLETQLHCSKSLEVVSSDLTELQKRVYITENKEKELSVNVALSKEYTSICFSKLQDNLLNYIERQIDGIPQPVIPSLDDAKKVMEEKLVPAALDAKNANLRSANNEHKILILEKKIEQLQLLLNKQQIQG